MASRILPVLLVLAVAGCVRPPARLDYGQLDEVAVADAQTGAHEGARVRWGGTIVTVRPESSETCFEVVSRPLDVQARPRLTDDSGGRFLACAPGFYDPAVYAADRDLTVVGRLAPPVERSIGDYPYRYPVVRAEAVYLWPEPEYDPAYRGGVSVGWYYWDYPYYWGGPYWWGGPHYYRGGPYYRHHHHHQRRGHRPHK